MFTIDEQTSSAINQFPAGINENAELTLVSYEPSKEGSTDMVLRFHFTGENQEKFTHTEFESTPEKAMEMAKKFGGDPNKRFQESVANMASRIKHIMSCFISENLIKISAPNWQSFCSAVITTLGTTYKGVKVRFKLIYDNKNYLKFPNRAVKPFIQRMDQPNTLVIDPRYDTIEMKAIPTTAGAGAPVDQSLFDMDLATAGAPAAPASNSAATPEMF